MEQQKKWSQRIKAIHIVFVILAIVGVAIVAGVVFSAYSYFHPKTQNVFDQLYYEVRTVKHGGNSVLITGTDTAYADYDFGSFQNIQILDLDVAIDMRDDRLYIWFFNPDRDRDPDTDWRSILYKYNLEEKRLYGERPVEYLVAHFLNDYFSWCDNAGKSNVYSRDDLGTFDFELQENVYFD